jgi:hypothetical protein
MEEHIFVIVNGLRVKIKMSYHISYINATLVWRDSGNARNGFYRSKCTYTREFDVIPAKGATYWPILRDTRACE